MPFVQEETVNELYPMIFKRKSFHTFRSGEPLKATDLQAIQERCSSLQPLVSTIRISFRIVPQSATTCPQGEYCILIYSEKKPLHLQNAGYLGEQLDLWLAAQNIGCCWYGMGKIEENSVDGLDFIIMLTIARQEEASFRKDYRKAKRKEIGEIWEGVELPEVASVVRYAPSACNTQPWKVTATDQTLHVERVGGRRGIMPAHVVPYYNRIDIGIFLLFLDLCLAHEGIAFDRNFSEETAEYTLHC
jgi:hypothetical protein